mmetsp:Transcript_69835/g.202634  ORF Transcript_69835/g.202634 Transcript_69835/m.202634 type:complete len:122 (-) Transcript_69835:259-624(-)
MGNASCCGFPGAGADARSGARADEEEITGSDGTRMEGGKLSEVEEPSPTSPATLKDIENGDARKQKIADRTVRIEEQRIEAPAATLAPAAKATASRTQKRKGTGHVKPEDIPHEAEDEDDE